VHAHSLTAFIHSGGAPRPLIRAHTVHTFHSISSSCCIQSITSSHWRMLYCVVAGAQQHECGAYLSAAWPRHRPRGAQGLMAAPLHVYAPTRWSHPPDASQIYGGLRCSFLTLPSRSRAALTHRQTAASSSMSPPSSSTASSTMR
jgi:hypothetical protein